MLSRPPLPGVPWLRPAARRRARGALPCTERPGRKNESPRDRILAAVNHETPDRFPTDCRGTPKATEMLSRHPGCEGPLELLRVTAVPVDRSAAHADVACLLSLPVMPLGS